MYFLICLVNSSNYDRISQISIIEDSRSTSSPVGQNTTDAGASFQSYFAFEDNTTKTAQTPTTTITQIQIVKKTLWSTVSNPIVFMTFIGLIVNFIFSQKIPSIIEPILTTLSSAFSAISLFYLGMSMVGRIRNLTFSAVAIMLVLIFVKSIFFPLITREMVLLISGLKTNLNVTSQVVEEENKDLSTFGFLYGTFPSAPGLLASIVRFKAVQQDLLSSAIVFGTLASAPLMMTSGKMISLQYFNYTSNSFDELQCKTAYAFSFATFFCNIWVLYIFLASGRVFMKPHRYTCFLILSQLFNSLIHIVWSSLNTDTSRALNYTNVFFTLFGAFMTRCIPLSIAINLITITKIQQYNQAPFNQFILKFIDNSVSLIAVGFVLPLLMATLCISVGGIPETQGTMISVGKGQIIISIVLLTFLVLAISYCLILVARTKFYHQANLLSIVSSEMTNNLSSTLENPMSIEPKKTEVVVRRRSEVDLIKKSINKLNLQYQIMQHISLVVISLFVTVICLFVQLWTVSGENVSGIFYELQILDTTLLYGQVNSD